MIVRQPRRRLCFAQEALPCRRVVEQPRPQHLERDAAVQVRVLGLEDDAHAADAEHFQHAISREPADLVGLLGRRQEVIDFLSRVGVGRFRRLRVRDARVARGRGQIGQPAHQV